jgi:hypothetical protein
MFRDNAVIKPRRQPFELRQCGIIPLFVTQFQLHPGQSVPQVRSVRVMPQRLLDQWDIRLAGEGYGRVGGARSV